MTAADVARCREILDAWDNGAAREEDLAELRNLLPGVLEAAVNAPEEPENPCPDCGGDGGVWTDHCQCGAFEPCDTCEGSGTAD